MRAMGPVAIATVVMLGLAVMVVRAAGRAPNRPASRGTATQPDGGGKVVYSRSGYDITPLGREQIDKLAVGLTSSERHILLDKGTERAFCGTLLDNKKEGVYVCRLCGLPLFASDSKFHSGTGWPSFFQPVDKAHVRETTDRSHGMVRTETACARCGAHLGHVFADGPAPTGLRYCMNSEALRFYEKAETLPPESRPVETQMAYFAGGCFWGVEDRFQQVPGVIDATSGYQGGTTSQPSYQQVCKGDTGHAETVRVTYDPKRITYRQLLERFFRFHDPTQLNRQGPDVGEQYRSAIFAANDDQLKEAKAFIEEARKSGAFGSKRITTVVEPAKPFYEAEEYHQDYHAKHGGSCAVPGLHAK